MEKEIEKEEIRQTIRENLTMLRKLNNLTQDELAQKVGKKKAAVGAWEQGTSLPDIYTMSELANIYGVSMEYLCGRECEEERLNRLQAYKDMFANTRRRRKNAVLDKLQNTSVKVDTDENGYLAIKEVPKEKPEPVTKQDAEDLLRATLDYARQLTEILERMENRDL